MGIQKFKSGVSLQALFAALVLLPFAALADSGIYVGGSLGKSDVSVGLGDLGVGNFDEGDDAYKAFLGYRLDLPVLIFAVEGGYVDLGEPQMNLGGASVSVAPTGMNLFALAGLEAGPVDLFVKAGYISWDADFKADDGLGNVETGSDSGSDLGYGVGLSFGLGPVDIRGEYEMYDISDADVSMFSVGFSYLFD